MRIDLAELETRLKDLRRNIDELKAAQLTGGASLFLYTSATDDEYDISGSIGTNQQKFWLITFTASDPKIRYPVMDLNFIPYENTPPERWEMVSNWNNLVYLKTLLRTGFPEGNGKTYWLLRITTESLLGIDGGDYSFKFQAIGTAEGTLEFEQVI